MRLAGYLTSCALLATALFAVAAFRANALLANRMALSDPVSYAHATFGWAGGASIAGIVTLVLWIVAVRGQSLRSRRGLWVSGIVSTVMVIVGLVAAWYVGLILMS